MHILFADDDPILREFALVHLSTAEVAVTVAADGAEALERLAGGAFDLLLVDLEMPKVDGFEVLRRVRGEKGLERLPVMVITGREDVAAIDQAYRLGATTFFTKPINWRLLNYQVLFVHRAALAETSLGREPAARGAGEARRLKEALGRLSEASRSFLADVRACKDPRLEGAERRYKAALSDIFSEISAEA